MSGCDSILTNDSNDNPINYKWEIDSISHNFDNYLSLEAVEMLYYDQDDIYILCESMYPHGLYFHYNGEEWKQHSVRATKQINSLCKFDDKIYCAAGLDEHQGRVLSFNRWEWEWTSQLTTNNEFLDIWSDGTDNIWVGGLGGYLYHYDGQDWKEHNLPAPIWIREFSGPSMDKLYALGYYLHSHSTRVGDAYLLKWTGEKWSIVDQFAMDNFSRTEYPFGYVDLYVTDDYIYTCGSGLFRKMHDEQEWTQLDDHNYNNIFASSSNNIYAVGNYGLVNYWNGKKWQELGIPYEERIYYENGFTDGEQVYILGYGDDKAYLIHGH